MYDVTVDPVRADYRGPVICIFWHEYLLTPFYLRGRSNSAILTSQHRDADWVAEAARHLGYATIRGSTSRGGSQALLEFMRGQGGRNLGIACDGPRGPRRCLAQGPIFLSSRLQIPLVLYGVGYDRPWRMPTWDRFAVPRPASRARVVVGPRMQIPADLTRDQMSHYRRRAETLLVRLTLEAEAWAEAGTRKQQQFVAVREPGHRIHRLPQHVSPSPVVGG
jgi:lysophospholipid acyltransferase (LPLAT)-like uncharacterized protein